MRDYKISVAMATYNGGKYIRTQMNSILRNLQPGDEIVVSDDGSTDTTLHILRSYARGEITVRVLEGPGKGIKQNIANAIAHCKGKYIFLADQDDVWTDDKVKKVMEYLGKDGCKLVCHDAKVMNGNLTEVLMPSFFEYRKSKPGFFKNLLKNRYMGCCMAFDSSLRKHILPIPDEIEMHDQWIGMKNDLWRGKSFFLKEKLLLYRRHDGNVSDFSHGTVGEMLKKRRVLFRAMFRRHKKKKVKKQKRK
ncbi:MAG: glycosyltransferase family 2 protein [Lachnospiraceae bacterium]|nr:glycosyltransferase family 2 protein [Lachnospiraceae bacterium]